MAPLESQAMNEPIWAPHPNRKKRRLRSKLFTELFNETLDFAYFIIRIPASPPA